MHFPPNRDPVLWVAACCALLGFAGFLMLALRAIWSAREPRSNALALLGPACLMVFYVLSAQNALNLAEMLHPTTLDLYLFSFDGSLGFQPSFWMGSLLRYHHALALISTLVYVSLPLAMGAAYAGYVDPEAGRPSWYMLELFFLAGLLGWLFYSLFPATGPIFVFPADFPFSPLSVAQLRRLLLEPIPVAQSIPRNAMPSLHMAWVILIWWNAGKFPAWARLLVLSYFIFTVMGTLGTGQHYFVDLVVAYPFALVVLSLCWSRVRFFEPRRYLSLLCGLVFTLAWFALLRYANGLFWVSPLIPWLAIVLTVTVVEVSRRWLFLGGGESRFQTPAKTVIEANAMM